MTHRRLGHRFENDWSDEELRKIYTDIESAVTIPVNIAIEGEHRILDVNRVEELLREADLIVLQDCSCRSDRGNCSAPRDVCISLDGEAEQMLKAGEFNVKKVTLAEALDALRRSHEAGLVHMAYTMEGQEQPSPICSCCSCCCHTLSGLVRFGLAKHVIAADLVSETNSDSCANCGVCVSRCQFRAREIVDGKLVHDSGRCFGCGLCVSTCTREAIRLVRTA